MNEMQVAERKVLRGDVIEKLYQNYGTDIRIASLKNYLRIRGFGTEEELRRQSITWAAKGNGISMWK